MATTLTNLSNALQEIWPQKNLVRHFYKRAKLFGLIRKDTSVDQPTINHQIQYGHGLGLGNTFAGAQALKAAGKYANFALSTYDKFGVFSIDGKALRIAKRSSRQVLRDIAKDGEGVLQALFNMISLNIYGNNGASLGQISSGSGSTTLTLKPGAQMKMFSVGMTIASDDTDGSASGAADDGEYVALTAVNQVTRQITKSGGNWNASGNFAADDHLFMKFTLGLNFTGLDAWIPSSDPSAGESFKGTDRSVDVHRLSGTRVTASAATHGTIEGALLHTVATICDLGGDPDVVLMNPLDWKELAVQLGSKTSYVKRPAVDAKGKEVANVGYSAIRIVGANGPIDVIADSWCPRYTAWVLTTSDWVLYSIGEVMSWLNEDGAGTILRESADNAYEGRFGGYMEMAPNNPGYHGRCDLTEVV